MRILPKDSWKLKLTHHLIRVASSVACGKRSQSSLMLGILLIHSVDSTNWSAFHWQMLYTTRGIETINQIGKNLTKESSQSNDPSVGVYIKSYYARSQDDNGIYWTTTNWVLLSTNGVPGRAPLGASKLPNDSLVVSFGRCNRCELEAQNGLIPVGDAYRLIY